jgi:uncharacterized protein YbaR (Trm112 family)
MPTLRSAVSFAASVGREVKTAATEVAHEARHHRPRFTPPAGPAPILDVGSGQNAHGLATIVVDKYPADDFERAAEATVDLSRPLVIGDAQALPFGDGAFVYVIARHVLEHATDPVRFAAELERVAPAGFVQVPSREAELTFGWAYHPWLIDKEADDTLVFHGRDDHVAPHGDLFHGAAADSKLFALWFAQKRSLFHHSVEWRGQLRVRMGEGTPSATTASFDLEATSAFLTRTAAHGGLRPLDDLHRGLLRCPVDHGVFPGLDGPLGAQLTCPSCSRTYPVVAGVPILLEEAAA